jgi:hypothetical protein
MNKAELTAAVNLAKDKSQRFVDDRGKEIVDTSIFDGFALYGFQPVTCTLRQLAALVRWQCVMMNGEIDAEKLNELADAGRHKFTVVGLG